MTRPRLLRSALLVLTPLVVVGLAACGGDDGETITVRHGEVPTPVLVDAGDEGPSAGDLRIFHFDGESDDGETVTMNWMMTTTAIDSPAADVESRVTTGVFAFGEGTDDQLVLEGVAFYPGTDATLKVSDTVLRSLIGGTGRFAGATGEVASTRLDDGSWEHVFHIDD